MRLARRMKRFIQRLAGLRHLIQDESASHANYKLIKLGSANCGWTIFDDPELQNGVVVSAGLGEDASFDVELASKYGGTVHIVDPTPRAITHFRDLSARIGKPRNQNYSQSGTQPIEAYDLQNVTEDQLRLHTFALWDKRKKVKFFLPKKAANVSHSIINFQNGYANDTPFIQVDAVRLTEFLNQNKIGFEDIALLKLDIEGAEIEVLNDIMEVGLFPRQILVEFDELNLPTRSGIARVDSAYKSLIQNGYRLVFTDHQADFLFVREK